MKNNFFKNKITVITDGASPLGKAIATEIALLKGDVILIGTKKEELVKVIKEIDNLKRKTGRIFAVTGDISTKEGCELVMRDAKKIAGTFEILINNGSIFSSGKFEDESPESIKKIIDTNITGTILLTKFALPVIKANKKPGIINICSFYGKVGMPYFSVFSSTKFAIAGFTESLQREYAGESLRVMGAYVSGVKTEEATVKDQKMEKLRFSFEKPDLIAKRIIDGYNEMQKEIVFGKKERGMIFWNGLNKKSVDDDLKKIKPQILSALSN